VILVTVAVSLTLQEYIGRSRLLRALFPPHGKADPTGSCAVRVVVGFGGSSRLRRDR